MSLKPYVVAILSALFIVSCGELSARSTGEAVGSSPPPPANCAPRTPTPSPDARWAHKTSVEQMSGRTDFEGAFLPGIVQVIHIAECDWESLRAHYALGDATHANTPPFSAFDRAGGLDRSYLVQVPYGTEKRTVRALAPNTDHFRFVGLVWNSRGCAGTCAPVPVASSADAIARATSELEGVKATKIEAKQLKLGELFAHHRFLGSIGSLDPSTPYIVVAARLATPNALMRGASVTWRLWYFDARRGAVWDNWGTQGDWPPDFDGLRSDS